MSAGMGAESLPYPDMDFEEACRRAEVLRLGTPDGQQPLTRPRFTPAQQQQVPFPVREPGASLRGRPVPVPRAARPGVADRGMLEQAIAGINRIPVRGEPVFAAAREAHYRPQQPAAAHVFDAPVPVQTPAPLSSVAGFPEGVVRGLLIAGLWEAVRWYEGMDSRACPDCDTEGVCQWHALRNVKALEYEELHDYVADARSDSAALAGIVGAFKGGPGEAGDLASPGSPLAGVLAAALEGGAR